MNAPTYRQLAAAAGLLLAAGLVLAGLGKGDGGTGLAATLKVDLEVPSGDANAHPCHPGTMTDRVLGRHPLYRRPSQPGVAGSMLAAGGWDWFLNPPSEV